MTLNLHQAAVAELKHFATEEQLAALNANPEAWYRELLTIKENVDHSLTYRRTKLAEYKAQCLLRGASGLREYRLEEIDFTAWKTRAMSFKKRVESKMRLVRELKRNQSNEQYESKMKDKLALTRNLLVTVLNDFARESNISIQDLAEELAVDYPDYADELRWIVNVVAPKVLGVNV